MFKSALHGWFKDLVLAIDTNLWLEKEMTGLTNNINISVLLQWFFTTLLLLLQSKRPHLRISSRSDFSCRGDTVYIYSKRITGVPAIRLIIMCKTWVRLELEQLAFHHRRVEFSQERKFDVPVVAHQAPSAFPESFSRLCEILRVDIFIFKT